MTWPTRPLGEVATIERTGVNPQEMPDDLPYLGLEHIERGGKILGFQTVGDAQLASAKFSFDEGHVLFGKLRPNLGKVARPEFRGICSTDILPIRPGKDLDRAYLHHYLAQPDMVAFAASRTSGANLPRLSPRVLATFEIPFPPLDEQRRIAEILDQADALRAKRRQALDHLDDLAQATFLAVFGDPLAAPPSSMRPLPEVLLRPPANGAYFPKENYSSAGVEMVHMSDVFYGTVRRGGLKRVQVPDAAVAKYGVDQGDLLIARRSLNFSGAAKPCMVPASPEPLLYESSLIRLTPNPEVTSVEYLFHYLNNYRVRAQWVEPRVTGATISGINQKAMATIPVVIPKTQQLDDFGAALMQLEAVRARYKTAEAQGSELLDSIVARAFDLGV